MPLNPNKWQLFFQYIHKDVIWLIREIGVRPESPSLYIHSIIFKITGSLLLGITGIFPSFGYPTTMGAIR
jgi:hypothetical protein